jgi:FixJ family two-component response regulator/PAS domain-containing protein
MAGLRLNQAKAVRPRSGRRPPTAIRILDISGEEPQAIDEKALSINEQYRSTNEKLLTSKAELQSLNEELTALNRELRETLERQRTTSDDLKNVLYSTDVATLFLDANLNIRFFTPATRSLFNIIPSDIGRPLAELSLLAVDGALLSDARTVLQTLVPLEREIEARSGAWYIRRIVPHRTQDNGVAGVVITFSDITVRRHATDALEAAKRQAQLANAAKSRFLAAASHDLRQPLQTLTLLQGLLARTVEGARAQELIGRFDETLGAMSGMLDTLVRINQTEVGVVRAEIPWFPIGDLPDRLKDELADHPRPAVDDGRRSGTNPLPMTQTAVARASQVGAAASPEPAVIFIVDDDSQIRESIRSVLEDTGRTVEDYASCEEFLAAYHPGREACLLIDAYLPGMTGLELLQRLGDAGNRLPAIMITGSSDVQMAVRAMKAGASDFIEKPIGRGELLASVERALEQSRDTSKLLGWRESAADHVAALTPRERQIMELVLAGHPSKNIAADLGISRRTVENHRAAVMKKTASKSLPALARLALAAAWDGRDQPIVDRGSPGRAATANR